MDAFGFFPIAYRCKASDLLRLFCVVAYQVSLADSPPNPDARAIFAGDQIVSTVSLHLPDSLHKHLLPHANMPLSVWVLNATTNFIRTHPDDERYLEQTPS
jgi:hypothetical protein